MLKNSTKGKILKACNFLKIMRVTTIRIKVKLLIGNCEPEDNEATLSTYLKKKINLNLFTYQKYLKSIKVKYRHFQTKKSWQTNQQQITTKRIIKENSSS